MAGRPCRSGLMESVNCAARNEDLPNSGAVCPTENITVASGEVEGDEVNKVGTRPQEKAAHNDNRTV